MGIHRLIRCGGQTAADLHCIVFQCLWTKRTKPCKLNLCRVSLAERQAPEPTLSENIIKLQIIDNHILYTMQSKSKSF